MNDFKTLVAKFKFAANSRASKLIKENASEKEIAEAIKTTKAYKESKELKDAVDTITTPGFGTTDREKKPEPEPVATKKSGEPRR